MTILTSLVGLAAGVLSTLSPCVLPLLPLVVGTAVSQHRFGPAALAAGLALSFVTIGLFVATIGFSIGLDASVFRSVAAMLMLGAGAVLLVPQFQTRLSTAAGPVGAWAEERFGGLTPTGLRVTARRGVESLCWPSTGRDIDPRRARQGSRRGRHRDGGLWRGRGAAIAFVGTCVSRGDASVALHDAASGSRRKSHSWRSSVRERISHSFQPRQESRDISGRNFTPLAHPSHDPDLVDVNTRLPAPV
jgi:hypothetical protein